ncbi:MAG: sialidase family protein [Gemmatimonadaceae bacterium]
MADHLNRPTGRARPRLRVGTTLMLVLAVSGRGRAQDAPRLIIGRNVQVSTDIPDVNHHEVVMAAHPTRRILLACSMLGDGAGRSVNTVAYRSNDDGTSWHLATVADEHFADDPTCAFAADGTAYVLTKTNTGVGLVPGASSDTDSLHVRRSRDGGGRWDPVIHSLQANDRPFMAVDTTRGPARGTMYVAFDEHLHAESGGHTNGSFRHALTLAASMDGGSSFSRLSRRLLIDQTRDTSAASLATGIVVLSTGAVVILQHHMLLGSGNSSTGKLREVGGWLQAFRSTDGGASLSPAVRIAQVVTGYNSPLTRGVSASLAADPGSAAFRDHLYAVWSDFSSGRGVIVRSRSVDGGSTWDAPQPVGSPSDAAGGDRFMPTVAVNRDGAVAVLWYERRSGEHSSGYDVRMTASLDGGTTWLPALTVSSAPNDEAQQRAPSSPPKAHAGWQPAAGTFSPTGGDTAGLAADAEGRFHPLWIDNRTGVQQVWTAVVTVAPR